jgi:hypothetical protein
MKQKIKIAGFYANGQVVRYVDHPLFRGKDFYSLAALKKHYGITKTTNTGKKEWAVMSRGGTKYWPILEAEIEISEPQNSQP